MCGVIIKIEKHASELPIEKRLGFDITVDALPGRSKEKSFNLQSDEHETFGGGPVCKFKGKELP